MTCSGHEFHLRDCDILFICPGTIHSIAAPAYGRRIIIQAELSALFQIKEIESLLTLMAPAVMITPEEYPQIHARIRELLFTMRQEYLDDTLMLDAILHAHLLEILVLIGRNHSGRKYCPESGYLKQKEFTEKFLYICNYINDHCTEDLSLDQVAELAGFSKYHFSRLFKKFANVSFYKYLNQKRIATAERLLIDPQLSVSEVALLSGFSGMSTFIRMFRIVKNCTPKEFRTMYIK